ncbi:tetratricopeptide repeat protein [Halodesulfovibrio spirochaetisodalis]|uniref:Tetratricopeptide repeat protein n=1 Tax=Halodesulfovibrio spirochaetisodalis TaxID=1560234 RepID=A0A1B7XQ48_9BACT|nr:tetratricopeptide repeat protein [Halodesulfovibrio spirochaetisodalis]OBQ57641.1 tetratricopeptide repeat protein [Halodesulfovibrio spirochaetisodalis]
MVKKFVFTFACALLLLGNTTAHAGKVHVLSAVVKDKTIKGAKVTWQRSGQKSVHAMTNANGDATSKGLPDDNDTMMLIEKDGYSTLIATCPCDGYTYALSPEMKNLDGLRVVLTWGYKPSDLDSHLVYENNHVYFKKKRGTGSNLDVDDTTSYGPETITITKQQRGKKYVYAVRDYSNGGRSSSTKLARSHARVDVYVGKSLLRTFEVDPTTKGTDWVVFGIDERGAFHDINKYTTCSGTDTLTSYLNQIIDAESFESNIQRTNTATVRAQQLNKKGEAAYQAKDYENAARLFASAINLDPELSQAYSNLGVTFPKLNLYAEALWANRKAIDLASGSRANIIRASSYYNIARIYEKKGEWNAALTNYRYALENREHNAYHKGIRRMENKLNQ